MEAIAFAIGLEPILARGQQLLDQYRKWKHNKPNISHLSTAFTSFEADLTECITHLQTEIEILPQHSRQIIESDIQTLNNQLRTAQISLQALCRSLNRTRLIQFLRANTVAADCEKLSVALTDARKLLRDAIKHADVRSAIQNHAKPQQPADNFRASFPSLISVRMQAVLDFDSRDETDCPSTPEACVKQLLLGHYTDDPRVISIHGIGGVGKSTIVKALLMDKDIRNHFVDGVYVIKLGAEATRATLLREICKVFTLSGAVATERSVRARNDVQVALQELETWFKGRRSAFFIDDAWVHAIGIGIFSQLCDIGSIENGSSIVITTREHDIAALAPTERLVRLKPRVARGSESRRILFFHASQRKDCTTSLDDGPSSQSIDEILDVCAGLPVCLAAAGKSVKKMKMDMPGHEKYAWQRYLAQLRICRDDVLRKKVDQYGSLYATFSTSIAFLDEKPQNETTGFPCMLSFWEMHRRLCVLERQPVVPMITLQHLWEVQSERHAELIARIFVEVGLASSEVVQMGSDFVWHLSLHDSLHDFAVMEADQHDESTRIHEGLLKRYSVSHDELCPDSTGVTNWWSRGLPADGYIHRNLCRHMLGARCVTELLHLLMTPQWTGRQLEVSNISILEADFLLGRRAIQSEMIDRDPEYRSHLETALQLIAEAASLSSSFVEGNRKEFWFQLHGRLIGLAKTNRWIAQYVDSLVLEEPKPFVRCLNAFLMEPGSINRSIVVLNVPVLCMQVMRDGERIACGCRDGRIIIVDLCRNKIEEEWKAHNDGVFAIAITFQRLKQRLVSASCDGTAKVWDFQTRSCVTTFENHMDAVNCLAVVENKNWIVSGSDDLTARIWETDTGEEITSAIRFHRASVQCIALLPNGDRVVTGGGDNKLRLWTASCAIQPGTVFHGHNNMVSCLAVLPGGNSILSGSCDHTMKIWDVASGEQIGDSLEGHTREVTCIAVSSDGTRIASGSEDKTICIWDAHSMVQVCKPLQGHASCITGVSFLADDNSIVSCACDGTLRVWDLRERDSEIVRNQHEGAVTSVSFAADGHHVVSGSLDRTLRIWDTKTGQLVRDAFRGHTDWVTGVAVMPDNRKVVSVSFDCTVRVWDMNSQALIRTLTGHNRPIHCVTLTKTGRYAITGARDATVRVWDLERTDGGDVALEGHSAGISRVFMSGDENRVISVAWNGEVFVWDLNTRQCLRQVVENGSQELPREQILDLAGESRSQDDARIVIPFWGRTISYEKGRDVNVLATLESQIRDWELSPDKTIICAGLQTGQLAFMHLEQ